MTPLTIADAITKIQRITGKPVTYVGTTIHVRPAATRDELQLIEAEITPSRIYEESCEHTIIDL